MTTPVFTSGSETNATMAFVMPAKVNTGKVPKPSDSSVTVRELAVGRFAVLRYSGSRNAKNEAEPLERLRAWMKAEGLKELSQPVYGYFDPPWTLAFLRRNEVMHRQGHVFYRSEHTSTTNQNCEELLFLPLPASPTRTRKLKRQQWQ